MVTTVDDPEQARADVRGGQLDGLLTISRATDGDLSYLLYTDEGLTGGTPTAIRTAVYQVSVGDRLQRAGVGAQAGQILAPAPVEIKQSDPSANDPEENFGARYLFAMALVILTFMAVITYGTWVASSVAEEKSSRVMELLITAATPRQLLGGKVLGTGAAGLTQYLVVVVASILGFVVQRVLAERLYGRQWQPDRGHRPGRAAAVRHLLPRRFHAVRDPVRGAGLNGQPAGGGPAGDRTDDPGGHDRLLRRLHRPEHP